MPNIQKNRSQLTTNTKSDQYASISKYAVFSSAKDQNAFLVEVFTANQFLESKMNMS